MVVRYCSFAVQAITVLGQLALLSPPPPLCRKVNRVVGIFVSLIFFSIFCYCRILSCPGPPLLMFTSLVIALFLFFIFSTKPWQAGPSFADVGGQHHEIFFPSLSPVCYFLFPFSILCIHCLQDVSEAVLHNE